MLLLNFLGNQSVKFSLVLILFNPSIMTSSGRFEETLDEISSKTLIYPLYSQSTLLGTPPPLGGVLYPN